MTYKLLLRKKTFRTSLNLMCQLTDCFKRKIDFDYYEKKYIYYEQKNELF